MDPVSMALNEPVVVDLNKYGSPVGESAPIGLAALVLATSGGGTGTSKEVGTFWEDVSTNKPLTLSLDYLAGIKFYFTDPVRARGQLGGVVTLSFSAFVSDSSGTTIDFKVCIIRSDNDAVIKVKVSQ